MSKVNLTLQDIKSLVIHASRNDTFPALIDVLFQWAEQANNELVKLQTELGNYKKASAFCEKHIPSGGARGQCLVCSGEKLSRALSAISYVCEESNEYQVSSYDLMYDEDAVVEQVKRKIAETCIPAVGQGTGCYPECYYYSDSCFRKDCKKK